MEIKFRGQRVDNGELVYGGSLMKFVDGGVVSYYMPQFKEKCIATHNRNENITLLDAIMYKIAPETVGQYINRKDEFNNEIYVGDMLEILYSDIAGEPKDLTLTVTSVDDWQMFKIIDTCNSIKIIGNIHNNKESLEKR